MLETESDKLFNAILVVLCFVLLGAVMMPGCAREQPARIAPVTATGPHICCDVEEGRCCLYETAACEGGKQMVMLCQDDPTEPYAISSVQCYPFGVEEVGC